MTFAIDVDKLYETRDGRVSSKTYMEKGDAAIYAQVDGKAYRYWPSGRADLVHESPMDLVKEWHAAVTVVGDAPPLNLKRERAGAQYITNNGHVVTLEADQSTYDKGWYFTFKIAGLTMNVDELGRAHSDYAVLPDYSLVAKWPSPNHTMIFGPDGSERWVTLEQAQRSILEGSITAQTIKEARISKQEPKPHEAGWLSFTPRKKADWTGATMANVTDAAFAEPSYTHAMHELTDATPISDMGKVSMTEALITDDKIATPAQSEGRKDDTGKLPYDLIAPEFLEEIAKVLEFGARKYAPRNWEYGMAWGRCFGALMRHMWSWWRGEQTDPETGFSHLAHAGCCLMFLTAYERRGTGTDNRWKGKPDAE